MYSVKLGSSTALCAARWTCNCASFYIGSSLDKYRVVLHPGTLIYLQRDDLQGTLFAL